MTTPAQVLRRTLDKPQRIGYTEVTYGRNNRVYSPAMPHVAGVSRSRGSSLAAAGGPAAIVRREGSHRLPSAKCITSSGGALMDAFDAAANAEQAQRDAALASVVAEAMAQEVHAEARAAQGLAGICEDCGGRIDAQRMAAYPWATRCRRCANREAARSMIASTLAAEVEATAEAQVEQRAVEDELIAEDIAAEEAREAIAE